eukprot:Rmarinus@m.14169
MSEELARYKQYQYAANANLVLTADRSLRSRPSDEPTGEPETLRGKLGSMKMGDRYLPAKPAELDERLQKLRKRKDEAKLKEDRRPSKRKHRDLTVADQFDAQYKPKTKETRHAWDLILSLVQKKLGDQPQDVIISAADEVLATLKNPNLNEVDMKSETEGLLGSTSNDDFADLNNLSKRITDYTDETSRKEGEAALDDEAGVAVEFEEDDEGAGSDEELDEIHDEDEEGEGEDDRMDTLRGAVDLEVEEEAEDELDVHDIDAFWLQRQVSKFVDDAHAAQKLAKDILGVLGEPDDRECENQLVDILEFDKFDFIKLLLKNRFKILYCTRINQAQTEEDKIKIQEEMARDSNLQEILAQMGSQRKQKEDPDKNFQRQLRREAMTLKQESGEDDEEMREAHGGNTGLATKPKAVIDLEALAFAQGGHYMANKSCELPKGSFRRTKKGYEEVHVPALKPTKLGENEHLVKIKELPEWAQMPFKGMDSLNRVQSKVYETAFKTAENLLLCAPTGAGKTNVALLTILAEIGKHMNRETGEINMSAFKIIYVAPMKALVAETVTNFGKRLECLGLNVRELTGDMALTRQQIMDTQIIVTTPEKWDIVTRKSGDRVYTQLVRLVIIDEIHLLHDDRGPVLESLVARTVRQIETTQEMIRLVGLSATLPNFEDVATFLRVRPDKGLFFFDNSYRPCPLQQQYIGISERKALKRMQLMNDITYEKVIACAGKTQVLVFVHSRKETARTARALRDMALEKDTLAQFLNNKDASRLILSEEAENVKNPDLKELLPYGFAIHHAGMTREDRVAVEDLMADSHIQVLVSTATLAWGVNLPAHTVIIKGTQIYNPEKSAWQELSSMDVMQMLGRAGRPQYDTFGEGIIITSHQELQFYLSLLNQQLPVESQFIHKLADNLNAEVCLGTVSNVREAVNWLGYTYLYVRMLHNPTLYGVSQAEKEGDSLLEQRRVDMIHSAALMLDKHHLVKYDRKSGNFLTTDLGRVASHFYVSHESIATYNEYLKPTLDDIDVFRIFSLSSEFRFMIVRDEEKIELQKLVERVPVPVKESLEEPSAKVNILLQAYISNLKLDGFALLSDMVYVQQSAGRILRALFEIVLKRGWSRLARRCLDLCKMVTRRMWNSQTPFRQFRSIPVEILKRIEKKDIVFDRFYDFDPHHLGELVRVPKMGRPLYKHLYMIPRLNLEAEMQPITRSTLRVELVITPDFKWDENVHSLAEPFHIFVEDVDEEKILHHEYFVLKQKFAEDEHVIDFTVQLQEPMPPQYFIKVVSDRWLGSAVTLPISFRKLILPEKYPPHTELLDLQPLPVSALRKAEYMALYPAEWKFFNPIQTQVFQQMFNSDDNALLAAPSGSGKTVAAEFAMLRMFDQNANGRCVFVTPRADVAHARFLDWRLRFGRALSKEVVELTGETAQDLKLLEKGNIIVSTPVQWDILSRRWRQRKNVQKVNLFIADELHFVGTEDGPTFEVGVSRMRYISAQNNNYTRIIGLSGSVANAKDLAEWLGASSHGQFNFHPNVRPVPLNIHIQGSDVQSFTSRMLSLARPTYTAVTNHSATQPALIFVPSRKYARDVAIDMLTFASADDEPKRFLHCSDDKLEPYIDKITNKALRHTLTYGVGFLHGGLSEVEKKIVCSLYTDRMIQVVVVTVELCWWVPLSAHLVVIMGTQWYDGREHKYAEYPLAAMHHMMGRAPRPLADDSGRCVVFCHSTKKEYYKKFLYDPYPVESHLNHFLHDNLNSEIVTRTVESKQDAVDYLTWTFLYRRLNRNPNYYNLQGTSHRHLSDFLSELVEVTIDDLVKSYCVSVENDIDLTPLNLGRIAAYYYVRYTTMELYSQALKDKTKLDNLLEVLSHASEFEAVAVRYNEDETLRRLAAHLPLKIDSKNYTESYTKVKVLLQAHFSRIDLPGETKTDLDTVLGESVRLVQAMVDVISSSGWLKAALSAMELSQMISQGLWDRDNELLQLPHFDNALAEKCNDAKVESIFDLTEMDDKDRTKLLDLPSAQLADVARACNRYPYIDLSYQIVDADGISAGNPVTVEVSLTRETEEDNVGPVYAPRFPKPKEEGWWVVVGCPKTNQLVCIKRINVQKSAKTKLQFVAPDAGSYHYTLYFMCDSYMGCDQEYDFDFKVSEASESEGESGSEDESE